MMLILCKGVSLAYGSRVVLHGLDFTVCQGDYLCVVGENGSGKSTLLKGLLKLLPVAAGRITYGDGFTPGRVGYLPQSSAANADFPAGVYEVVLSGCLARRGFMPFYTKSDRSIALESMRRLGIADLGGERFGELSGGQRQRVLLARALCSAGTSLIMDEPVSGLDPVVAKDFYDMADSLHSSGMSIIMVSHDVSRAVSRATHVLHLNGRQEFFGKKDEYLRSELGKRFAGSFNNGGVSRD
ncbi:MAG: metal ABC transporter ATP-binding protein [Synergistaceae bacterium]|nr:metal ABC transporter ATP-binding protein [Synergistaceae bacterium]